MVSALNIDLSYAQERGVDTNDWRVVQQRCKTLTESDTAFCVHYTMGFIESMAFQEHALGLEPKCISTADLRALGNKVIAGIRSESVNDSWSGLYLTAIVLRAAGCRYVRMTNPPKFPLL